MSSTGRITRAYVPAREARGETAGQAAVSPADGGSSFSHLLSPRDSAVVSTVRLFRQASASQLRRLHFAEGSLASQGVKQRRSLHRLVKRGHLNRIDRPVGGWGGGSADFIYLPAGSRTRIPDPHTLDITELYVRLVESGTLLLFEPEPYCHRTIGHLELKPDGFVDLRADGKRRHFWVELDRGTEYRQHLHQKMRRYVQAYNHWPEPTYPQVLFIVPDDLRKRLVESVVKRQEHALFSVVEFEKAIEVLTKGK